MHILHVVGARPNFVKAAPVLAALARRDGVRQTLVHTGQHYDVSMSDVFFQQLGIPDPDINLGVGSGTHAQQTADIMTRFEPLVRERRPEWVVVYGDVNSTIAAALVCAKLQIRVAHVEAGLRSYDRGMPEEINRVLTDQISDLLLTPSSDANENLAREGIPERRVRLVGNVMIDSLVRLLPAAKAELPEHLPPRFMLVTMHRPSNVDDAGFLRELLESLREIGRELPVLFPIHPRTRQRIAEFGLDCGADDGLRFFEPMSYLRFLGLQTKATIVLTDSGGVQEETTYLGIPCLTMRQNTERPVTTTLGTNVVIGRDVQRLCAEVARVLRGERSRAVVPPLWDGHTAERIADSLLLNY